MKEVICDGAGQHNEVQSEGKVKLNHATPDTHFMPTSISDNCNIMLYSYKNNVNNCSKGIT